MIEISDRFPQRSLGRKYPRVYQAANISDMQQARGEMAKGIHNKAHIIGTRSFGSQPNTLNNYDTTAIIYIPEIQHYPARDPQEDIRRMGGATIHDNLGMRLADKSDLDGILVWYHDHSFLDFPYPTVFDDIGPGSNTWFNKDKWKTYRESSWRLNAVLLAQYTELSKAELRQLRADGAEFPDNHPPVTEMYWLLHVFDPDGVVRRKGRERVAVPSRELVPAIPPILA